MSTIANTTPNNITVYRGDDFSTKIVFNDTNGVPINLTGWEFFFTIKLRVGDPDSVAIVTVTEAPTDPLNGITQITVSNTITYNLLGSYYYDFQFKNASGNINTITSGTINFISDITRRIS